MPLNDADRLWIEAIVQPIVDLQAEHHRTLFGNGSESYPGLRVDVDRIKEIEKDRKWHIRAIWGAIIAGVVKAGMGLFGKVH